MESILREKSPVAQIRLVATKPANALFKRKSFRTIQISPA